MYRVEVLPCREDSALALKFRSTKWEKKKPPAVEEDHFLSAAFSAPELLSSVSIGSSSSSPLSSGGA